jgi:hypothetical protein
VARCAGARSPPAWAGAASRAGRAPGRFPGRRPGTTATA